MLLLNNLLLYYIIICYYIIIYYYIANLRAPTTGVLLAKLSQLFDCKYAAEACNSKKSSYVYVHPVNCT